ncbi:MAG TPA: hypothetical protein VFL14_08430, partial [Xanthomonadales bacterium]|nr:hypothetical protein [Xanthomonadales bacterium]
MFSADFYVRIARDRIDVRNVATGQDRGGAPARPFTSTRLLVGDFVVAQELLRCLVDEVAGSRLRFNRRFVMHAIEMIDGGLSPVEERVLLELAAGAGAKRAVAWTGRTLSDDEVRQKV